MKSALVHYSIFSYNLEPQESVPLFLFVSLDWALIYLPNALLYMLYA